MDFDPCEISAETHALVGSDDVLLSWWLLAELRDAVAERRDFVVLRKRA